MVIKVTLSIFWLGITLMKVRLCTLKTRFRNTGLVISSVFFTAHIAKQESTHQKSRNNSIVNMFNARWLLLVFLLVLYQHTLGTKNIVHRASDDK